MNTQTYTFRFDDVSVNTDSDRLLSLIEVIRQYRPASYILLAISPIVFSPKQLKLAAGREGHEQRVHPTELTAMSSLIPYYLGQRCGIPDWIFQQKVIRAGHGIAHVDHRLLDYQAQELSIIMSCALAQATSFIPPYNKWNADTEKICYERGIRLVKFEDGWKHALYNEHQALHKLYYMHPYDMIPSQLTQWFIASGD